MLDDILSGYQPRQVSVLNRRFEDHLGHHHQGSDDGPRNVGSIQIPDAADSPRRFN
jgi:hypothetical protein